MRVQIQQPGELFSARDLVVHAEVETDGVLLSGADVRLFDARGRQVRGPRNPLTVRSVVTAETTVVLDDAFARRTFEPQQTFHFDEVIPDAIRVEDIKLALRDLQFVVKPGDLQESKVGKTQTLVASLVASRSAIRTTKCSCSCSCWVASSARNGVRSAREVGGSRASSTPVT